MAPKPGSYLESGGSTRQVTKYVTGSVIFSQGDAAKDVRYVREGAVKLTVLSHNGKEAVVAVLAPGDFFGEGVLAGQTIRMMTAKAMSACTIVTVEKATMARWLHTDSAFSGRFIARMLERNLRVEADLVDQLFNSSERRLARTLLLLSRYSADHPQTTLPHVSQETLAEMIGSTRTRVNFFMNKFRRLGLIEYNGRITVNAALVSVVLQGEPPEPPAV